MQIQQENLERHINVHQKVATNFFREALQVTKMSSQLHTMLNKAKVKLFRQWTVLSSLEKTLFSRDKSRRRFFYEIAAMELLKL